MSLPTPHIAGDTRSLTAQQLDWVALAATLGRERFAPRAALHDREASFPFENMADLRDAGLLKICVPREHGGLGADFFTYALVAAELGRHCAATALCWNMHVSATLWVSQVADALEMPEAMRAQHHAARRHVYDNVARRGLLYSQSISEGGAAAAGKAPWATLARRVDGGYRVSGRKIFASLAGAADVYGVLCTLDVPGAVQRDAVYLGIPADAPGVQVSGDWDPLGMRATVSRTLVFDDVFVADESTLLPVGLFAQGAQRYPHMFATLTPTYMGLAQAAYDFTVAYLRAEWPGMPPVQRRMYATKQVAVAQMRVQLEQTRALWLQTMREAAPDLDTDARQRLYANQYTVMENAQSIAALALRTCGGQALLKGLPLERLYRDARCGSLMLPWTAELCIDRLGHECLYESNEHDEAID